MLPRKVVSRDSDGARTRRLDAYLGGPWCDIWRGVRVAEGARLEIVCRGDSTEGSNPSLSAIARLRRGAGVVERGGLENR